MVANEGGSTGDSLDTKPPRCRASAEPTFPTQTTAVSTALLPCMFIMRVCGNAMRRLAAMPGAAEGANSPPKVAVPHATCTILNTFCCLTGWPICLHPMGRKQLLARNSGPSQTARRTVQIDAAGVVPVSARCSRVRLSSRGDGRARLAVHTSAPDFSRPVPSLRKLGNLGYTTHLFGLCERPHRSRHLPRDNGGRGKMRVPAERCLPCRGPSSRGSQDIAVQQVTLHSVECDRLWHVWALRRLIRNMASCIVQARLHRRWANRMSCWLGMQSFWPICSVSSDSRRIWVRSVAS